MTISFHHAFREGDKVINQVVDALAKMGFKGLTLASNSLLNCHDPLVEHIKSGVITRIYSSVVRGKLGEAISNGLMEVPVQIHSHGGRAFRRTAWISSFGWMRSVIVSSVSGPLA
jgi:citrate lyase subunit alpha / citrate CoA-transferase